jgi:pimeloyl-ACP methyl ester carboxylesterase
MAFTRSGSIRTPVLDIAYEEAGPADGPVAVLSHGFPYDVRAYDDVAGLLAASGVRVIAPYLRGFGPTRFTDAATLRSGEQGALGQDLLDLLDALEVERAVVGGYDWADACRASSRRCTPRVSLAS